jgi:hypothetical protein
MSTCAQWHVLLPAMMPDLKPIQNKHKALNVSCSIASMIPPCAPSRRDLLLPCVSFLCSWAESELLDTLMRLEVGLAGRVESWKANKWAAKLEELKTKKSSLVSL